MTNKSNEPLASLPRRNSASHKGDYGRALIVGGSLGMAGAPTMAALACLRSGAGLTSIASPKSIQPTVASFSPAYTTHPLADDGERLVQGALDPLRGLLAWSTATAIGPGLDRSEALVELVTAIYTEFKGPMVVDADALNALSERPEVLDRPGGPRVLTPHAGEFARLSGSALKDPADESERIAAAARFASTDSSQQTVLVLKGDRTVVAEAEQYAINATGNPGMATGGSGDVLTGVIVALLAQGVDPFESARLAAHVHGLAGDLAEAKLGETSLIATDLIESLPSAWQSLSS